MRPAKRPSASSIAGETDTSVRAKFRNPPRAPQPSLVFGARQTGPIPSRHAAESGDSSHPDSTRRNINQAEAEVSRLDSSPQGGGQREQGEEVLLPGQSRTGVLASEEQDDSMEEKRILTLHSPTNGTLAAAWYDPETRKIEVLEDTKDTLSWDLAVLILEQVQPDMIFMSSKTHFTLVDQARKWDEQNQPNDTGSAGSTRITILTYKACSYHAAISHLATLRLPDRSAPISAVSGAVPNPPSSQTSGMGTASYADDSWRDEGAGMGSYRLNLVKLGCWVDVDAPAAIIATGILISEVKKARIQQQIPEMQGGFGLEVSSLERMNLDHHMIINQDALTSLAVFSTEDHAFMYTQHQKLGLSVFGLLSSAVVTPLGKKLLHTWHLRPLLSLEEIAARHEAVGLFAAPENKPIAQELSRKLKSIKNLPNLCSKLRSGRAKYQDWRALVESIVAACEAKDLVLCIPHRRPIDIIDKLRNVIPECVPLLSGTINQVIDWDESKIQNRVCVRPGVDEELDSWREQYAELDSVLNEAARIIAKDVPLGVSNDCSALYLPQIGFHAILESEDDQAPVVPGWNLKFKTDNRYYYKTKITLQLDQHYGDIANVIRGREVDIIQAVIERLREQEPEILATINVIAELDCLLALAQAVDIYNLRRPVMTDDKTLKIRKGRHILYEITATDQYIPNDTLLQGGNGDAHHSMMIITGANGSGKSAYGKQVALIVFMAQIGSFVPATDAVIGIVDKIFTRLQTKESVSKTASAFMIDLSQVSQALRGATERSLIILDEFGKGTISCDGAGLLTGVITYLLKTTCPRTVILTHFHELFTQGFLSESEQVLFAHMKTEVAEDAEKLYYLYRLVPSPCLTSYAAECALIHGIPKNIVDRARFVTKCIATFQFSQLFDMSLTPAQIAEMKSCELLAKRFLSWKIDEEDDGIMDTLREMLEETKFELEAVAMEEEEEEESQSYRSRGEDGSMGIRKDGDRTANMHEEEDSQRGDDGDSIAYSDETD